MISAPFSAWILRIENMRSCLRIVDAPSTPISSAIATSSAGGFFFNSFNCIWQSFLGKLGSGFLEIRELGNTAGTPLSGGTVAGGSEKLAGGPLRLRGMYRRGP